MSRYVLAAVVFILAAPALSQTAGVRAQVGPGTSVANAHGASPLTCPDLIPTPVTFTVNGTQLEGRFRVRNIGTGALNAQPWEVLVVATTRYANGHMASEQATVFNLAAGAESQTFTVIRSPAITATTTVEIRGVPGECSTANNRSVTRYSGS